MTNKKSFFEKITDLIFPPHLYCICCGAIINKTRTYGICDDCIEKINWVTDHTCSKCGKLLGENYFRELCADCMETERHFDKGYTCMRYGLYERRILADFKFNGRAHLADYLGKILADRMSYENEHPDIITSVPAHKTREKKRGYNQAELMARKFAQSLNKAAGNPSPGSGSSNVEHTAYPQKTANSANPAKETVPASLPYMQLLERTRATRPMKNLSKMQRYDNVYGAFAVKPGMEKYITGQTVAIVDDIFTTGSTLDECSRVLKEAGADRVIIITVAAGSNIPPKAQ